MKRYATTLILASTLLIGEIHTFWEKLPVRYENWIIQIYKPLTIQWNVKFVGDELNWILFTIAMWCFGKYPNRVNKITVGTFIALAIADMGLYFWNFKTVDFHYVYFCMAGIWALIYFRLAERGISIVWHWLKSIKQRLIG